MSVSVVFFWGGDISVLVLVLLIVYIYRYYWIQHYFFFFQKKLFQNIFLFKKINFLKFFKGVCLNKQFSLQTAFASLEIWLVIFHFKNMSKNVSRSFFLLSLPAHMLKELLCECMRMHLLLVFSFNLPEQLITLLSIVLKPLSHRSHWTRNGKGRPLSSSPQTSQPCQSWLDSPSLWVLSTSPLQTDMLNIL